MERYTDASVEVEEAFRTVDVVERSETRDESVNSHWMNAQGTLSRHEQPMRVGSAHEHLSTQIKNAWFKVGGIIFCELWFSNVRPSIVTHR